MQQLAAMERMLQVSRQTNDFAATCKYLMLEGHAFGAARLAQEHGASSRVSRFITTRRLVLKVHCSAPVPWSILIQTEPQFCCRACDVVKFAIEITGRSGGRVTEVIHRSTVNVISPRGAMTAARAVLKLWKNRGANGARILNRAGEAIHDWKE